MNFNVLSILLVVCFIKNISAAIEKSKSEIQSSYMKEIESAINDNQQIIALHADIVSTVGSLNCADVFTARLKELQTNAEQSLENCNEKESDVINMGICAEKEKIEIDNQMQLAYKAAVRCIATKKYDTSMTWQMKVTGTYEQKLTSIFDQYFKPVEEYPVVSKKATKEASDCVVPAKSKLNNEIESIREGIRNCINSNIDEAPANVCAKKQVNAKSAKLSQIYNEAIQCLNKL